MSDEFGNWNELAGLWHAEAPEIAPREVARHARRQRRATLALAAAEAGAMALAFVAAMWIAMHTAFVAMSAISLVFFGLSGYLHHRMRHEPQPGGNGTLRASLETGIAREEWLLRQLGVGRAVTTLTLAAIVLVGADHLRFFATTPAPRLWALLAITLIVLAILAWNVVLTRRARRRRQHLADYSRRLGGP
jgi:heme/copper-type cytochrome/quinol oxidase subunit 2